MADYWKSQPKKFCQYCKCWIADNKPSIEFHERGKNHKENVAAKIAEIKKKSIDKVKQDERMSKEFAAMEEAAMKAYQEDMKRMGIESGSQDQTTAKAQPQPQPQHRPQPQPQPRPQPQRQKKTKKQVGKESRKPHLAESSAWVEGKTDSGHTYYYNSLSGESKWEKPEGFQGESSHSAQLGQNESPPGSAWMEAVSPDGYTYYYNSETGESSWERPADLPSKEASGSGSGSSREGAGQEEPSTPPQEPLSGGEESSNEAGGDEQASQEPKVPKISFRKRKAETEPSEKEGEDKGSEGDEDKKKDGGEKKGEEEAQSTTAVPEEKKEEEKTKAKRPRAFNPYGTWEQIQEEEDPYAKVDLQLPQVEGGAASAPDDRPPEPKPKFKERTVTSLGEEGGPASFRKSKTQNGKCRSLRQRGKDD